MVIIPNTENISKLFDEIHNNKKLSFESLCEIGNQFHIEFDTYDNFYNNLPEDYKQFAPPKIPFFFGLVNPVTNNPKIVVPDKYTKRFNPSLYEIINLRNILEHEMVHVHQYGKRFPYIKDDAGTDPSNRKQYFSDKDEIMAFSQSIVNEILTNKFNKSKNDLFKSVRYNRLYLDIKNTVDPKIFNKYKKYIYQYINIYTQ